MAGLAAWPELAELLAGATRVGPIRVMANWHGYFREAAGPGWALLGDAGHFKDPRRRRASPTPCARPSTWPAPSRRASVERPASTRSCAAGGAGATRTATRCTGLPPTWGRRALAAAGSQFTRDMAGDEEASRSAPAGAQPRSPAFAALHATPARQGRRSAPCATGRPDPRDGKGGGDGAPQGGPPIQAAPSRGTRLGCDRMKERCCWPSPSSGLSCRTSSSPSSSPRRASISAATSRCGRPARPSTQLLLDLVIAALAFFVWAAVEGPRARIRRWWLCIPATLLVGLCFGLPLFL